jgi:hypothetical protein
VHSPRQTILLLGMEITQLHRTILPEVGAHNDGEAGLSDKSAAFVGFLVRLFTQVDALPSP